MEDVRTKLDEELVRGLNQIKGLQPGTEVYSEAVEAFVKLYNLRSNDAKIDVEYERLQVQELQNEDVKLKNAWEHIYSMLKLSVETGMTVLQVKFLKTWLTNGYLFEEKGYVSSFTTRSFLNKYIPLIRPFKK